MKKFLHLNMKLALILTILNLSRAIQDYRHKECDLKNIEKNKYSNEFMFKSCIIPMNGISRITTVLFNLIFFFK
jgi:hypothetical protein